MQCSVEGVGGRVLHRVNSELGCINGNRISKAGKLPSTSPDTSYTQESMLYAILRITPKEEKLYVSFWKD